jgi:hypothetical protein
MQSVTLVFHSCRQLSLTHSPHSLAHPSPRIVGRVASSPVSREWRRRKADETAKEKGQKRKKKKGVRHERRSSSVHPTRNDKAARHTGVAEILCYSTEGLLHCCGATRTPRSSTGRPPAAARPLAADWSASASSRWAAACRAPARKCQRYDTQAMKHAMPAPHASWRRHRGHPKRTAVRSPPFLRVSLCCAVLLLCSRSKRIYSTSYRAIQMHPVSSEADHHDHARGWMMMMLRRSCRPRLLASDSPRPGRAVVLTSCRIVVLSCLFVR